MVPPGTNLVGHEVGESVDSILQALGVVFLCCIVIEVTLFTACYQLEQKCCSSGLGSSAVDDDRQDLNIGEEFMFEFGFLSEECFSTASCPLQKCLLQFIFLTF